MKKAFVVFSMLVAAVALMSFSNTVEANVVDMPVTEVMKVVEGSTVQDSMGGSAPSCADLGSDCTFMACCEGLKCRNHGDEKSCRY